MWDGRPSNTFCDHEVAVGLRCGKASTKTLRSLASLNPVFVRDSSGRSIYFFNQEGVDKISYLVSLVSKNPNGKKPPRVNKITATCPNSAPEDPHRVYGRCLVF